MSEDKKIWEHPLYRVEAYRGKEGGHCAIDVEYKATELDELDALIEALSEARDFLRNLQSEGKV